MRQLIYIDSCYILARTGGIAEPSVHRRVSNVGGGPEHILETGERHEATSWRRLKAIYIYIYTYRSIATEINGNIVEDVSADMRKELRNAIIRFSMIDERSGLTSARAIDCDRPTIPARHPASIPPRSPRRFPTITRAKQHTLRPQNFDKYRIVISGGN